MYFIISISIVMWVVLLLKFDTGVRYKDISTEEFCVDGVEYFRSTHRRVPLTPKWNKDGTIKECEENINDG